MEDNHTISDEFEIRLIRPHTAELAVLERLKKFPLTYNRENLVSTPDPLFLIGSFSFLLVTRTIIKAWMSLNFGRITLLTSKFATLERLKKTISLLTL